MIASKVPHCDRVTFAKDAVCPKITRMIRAKMGATRKRRYVAVINETFLKSILENEVVDPHMTPASRAKIAAMRVSLPGVTFMRRSLNVTK